MNELKIHDIKPLVEIPDYSFYLFITLIILSILLFVFLFFYLYKKIKNRKTNPKKIYSKKLKEIDLSKSKKASYEITKYLNLLPKNEKQRVLANELIINLKQYKYKKETKEFNEETINLYKNFMESLNA